MPTNLAYKLPTLADYLNNIKKKKQPINNLPIPAMQFPMPSVAGILNPLPVTPPLFDPTVGESPDLTVPSDLPREFGGAMPKAGTGEESKGGGKRALLANIFDAIASGAAIFGSDKPGEMLARQLEQRAQQLLEKRRQDIAQESDTAQREFQQAMERERIAARKEEQKTEFTQRKELQKSEQEFTIKRDDVRFTNDVKMQTMDNENRKVLQELGILGQLRVGAQNQEFAKENIILKNQGDIDEVMMRNSMAALWHVQRAGIVPTEQIVGLYKKIRNNEALTQSDFALLDKSRKAMQAELRTYGGGVGGGIGREEKRMEKLQDQDVVDLMKTRHAVEEKFRTMKVDVPMINPVTQRPVIINGKPQTVETFLSDKEIQQRMKEFDAANDYDNKIGRYYQDKEMPPTKQNTPATSADETIFNLRRQKYSDAEIEGFINSSPYSAQQKEELKKKLKSSVPKTKSAFGLRIK